MVLLLRNLDENGNDEKVCTDLEETFDYLINLWVAGHATWVEAFRIRNDPDFKNHAVKKKQEAEAMIQKFIDIKENAKPIFCNCFLEGTYYNGLNQFLNPNADSQNLVRSASECQLFCFSKPGCEFWTYVQHLAKCFMFESNPVQGTVSDDYDYDKKDIISGPKVCPIYFSFCCDLGYTASVFITFFVVLACVLFAFCCCTILNS